MLPTLLKILIPLAAAWLSYQWYIFHRITSKIDFIPTIGLDGFFGSYFSAWKYMFAGNKLIEAGYKKYHGGVFRVATFESAERWLIVVSGQDMVEDLRRAGDALNSDEHVIHFLQMEHTFGAEVVNAESYHISVTQRQMTRNVGPLFPDIVDEMRDAFDKRLPLSEDWTPYTTIETFANIICRISNRFFFTDLPLCRNLDFINLQTGFAVQLIIAATAIGLFPAPLRPIAGRILSRVPSSFKKLTEMIGPMLQDRLDKRAELGAQYEGRPNDLVSWLLESAPENQRTVDDLVTRIMFSNFAAIHTTSITLSEALFNIAGRQEYVEPLRAEVEGVIAQHGWTREATHEMHKLDSFIKECSRLYGMNSVGLVRKTLKDFTFSNGLTIPAGYTIGCVTHAAQWDSSLHENSEVFDGYRFLNEENETTKLPLVSQDPKFLHFGSGRHMCPGRFFAAAEIKAILAHILINYDIRFPGGSTTQPEEYCFGTNRTPNPSTKVEFKRRKT